MMFMCKFLSKMTLTFVLALGGTIYAGSPEVLKHVPSTAELVVVTSNVSVLETKLATIVERFGLPDEVSLDVFRNEFASALGMAEPLELDNNRPICIVMTAFSAAQKALMVYFPVDDPEALLEKTNGEKLENGIYKFNSDGFMTAKGKHLVIATSKENMNMAFAAPQGVSLPEAVKGDMVGSDISVYANLTNIMNMARFGLPMFLGSVPEVQNQPELMTKIQETINVLAEINKLSLSISMQDDCILTKANMFYMPGGGIAKTLKPYKKVAAKELAALPDGKLMAAQTMSFDPAVMKDFYGFVLDIISMASQGKVDGLNEFLDSIKEEMGVVFEEYADKINLYVQGDYVAETEGIAPEAGALTLIKSDFDKESIDKVINGFTDKKLNDFFAISSYEKDAGNVDGVDYSSLKYFMGQPTPSGKMFKTDIELYFGKSDANTYVQTMDKNALPEVIALSRKKETLAGNEEFMSVLGKLPETANMFMVIDASNMLSYAGAAMTAQSQEMAKENPEMAMQVAIMGPVMNTLGSIDGYMGVSLEMEEGYLRCHEYVSMSTIESAVDAIKGIVQQYMGLDMSGGSEEATEF